MKLKDFFQKYDLMGGGKKGYNIYCDMDGVLTDFHKAFINIDGRTKQQVKKDAGYDANMHNCPAYWKHIESAGEDFWSYMPWMKDGKELWQYILRFSPSILSAPTLDPVSRTGKIKWVQRELGSNIPVFLTSSETKKDFATPYSVLIDDKQEIIDSWIKEGGIGIVHKSAKDTIKKLSNMDIK